MSSGRIMQIRKVHTALILLTKESPPEEQQIE